MMTILRWKKVINDLLANRSRTFMAAVATTVGIVGIGAVLCAYTILVRELDANYARTKPASATITVQPVSSALIDRVRRIPGVRGAEARGLYQARIRLGEDPWKTLFLFVIDDFDSMTIALSKPEVGATPPRPGEILIERAAFRVLGARAGDTVTVRLLGIGQQGLRVSGGIHDPAQAPAWMEGLVYGYVTKETLALFGHVPLNQVLLTVAEKPSDKAHIRSVVKSVTDSMTAAGYRVGHVDVPEPGQHPHQTQLKALLFLLQAFGGLCFLLSTVLVITLIGAMMSQQTRQIGVMKAIGARVGQVAALYLSAAPVLGCVAILVGIPLSVLGARAYARFAAGMLNFEIVNSSVPLWTYVFLVAIGLVIPALAALYPVLRGSRITIREAISDYGIAPRAQSSRVPDRIARMLTAVPRPLLLSLRNTFRRTGRTAFTLGTLAVGGAMFITALTVAASVTKTIGVFQNAMKYDLRVTLTSPLPFERVAPVAQGVPGVVRVEGWGQARASIVYPDGTDGNGFVIMAPPIATDLLQFRIIEGRGLTSGDTNSLIVNHIFMDQHPQVKVGDDITLRLAGRKTAWHITGVIRQIGPPTAFTAYDHLSGLLDQKGLVKTVAVVTRERSVKAHRTTGAALEEALSGAGIDVNDLVSIYSIQRILEDHFVVLTTLLLLMSGLIAVVGGLALLTTMSIQVMERTREIGVMRALGASNHELFKIIGAEGLTIGILSWVLAVVLAVPLSKYVGDIFGLIFVRTTLDFALSGRAFILWLAAVVLLSLVASYFPARKATRLTIRETLVYE
jgi:putative ABC transport system permease protein